MLANSLIVITVEKANGTIMKVTVTSRIPDDGKTTFNNPLSGLATFYSIYHLCIGPNPLGDDFHFKKACPYFGVSIEAFIIFVIS